MIFHCLLKWQEIISPDHQLLLKQIGQWLLYVVISYDLLWNGCYMLLYLGGVDPKLHRLLQGLVLKTPIKYHNDTPLFVKYSILQQNSKWPWYRSIRYTATKLKKSILCFLFQTVPHKNVLTSRWRCAETVQVPSGHACYHRYQVSSQLAKALQKKKL